MGNDKADMHHSRWVQGYQSCRHSNRHCWNYSLKIDLIYDLDYTLQGRGFWSDHNLRSKSGWWSCDLEKLLWKELSQNSAYKPCWCVDLYEIVQCQLEAIEGMILNRSSMIVKQGKIGSDKSDGFSALTQGLVLWVGFRCTPVQQLTSWEGLLAL